MQACHVPAGEDGLTVHLAPGEPVAVTWPCATPRMVKVTASSGSVRFSLRGNAAPDSPGVAVVPAGEYVVAETRFEATPIALRLAADQAVTVTVTGLLDATTGVSAGHLSAPGPPPATTVTARMTRTAATPLSGHRVVTPGPSGLVYADAATADHAAAPLWVTATAAAAGYHVDVVAAGPITEPSWSWTPGPVWLGSNGALTQVMPAMPSSVFCAQIGYAVSATELVVDRSLSVRLAP